MASVLNLMKRQPLSKPFFDRLSDALSDNAHQYALGVHRRAPRFMKEQRKEADELHSSWLTKSNEAVRKMRSEALKPPIPNERRISLNRAAERFLKARACETVRYWFWLDSSKEGVDLFERVTRTLNANRVRAALEVRGSRPTKKSQVALAEVEKSSRIWDELQLEELTKGT